MELELYVADDTAIANHSISAVRSFGAGALSDLYQKMITLSRCKLTFFSYIILSDHTNYVTIQLPRRYTLPGLCCVCIQNYLILDVLLEISNRESSRRE